MSSPAEQLLAAKLNAKIAETADEMADQMVEAMRPALGGEKSHQCSGVLLWFAARVAEEMAARLREKAASVSGGGPPVTRPHLTPSAHRRRLPNRRLHEAVRFECGGQTYVGGFGRFPDGSLAEVFLSGAKTGSDTESNAQDAALVASLALQHGCPVDTIRHALSRSGRAGGPLVTLLELIADRDGGPGSSLALSASGAAT